MIGILINYLTQKFQTFNYLQSVYGLAGFEDGDNKFLWVYQNTEKVILNLDTHQSCSLFLTNGKVDTAQEESQLVANEYNVVKKYPFKALVYIQGNEDVNCITESQKIADSIQKSITGRQKQILASTQLTDAYIEVTGTNSLKEEIYKQYYSNGGLQEKDILVEIEFEFVVSGNQNCFVDSPCSDDEYIFSFDAPQTFCERVDACLDIPTADGQYVLTITGNVISWEEFSASGLVDGNGTTVNGNKVDLGGDVIQDTILAFDPSQYKIIFGDIDNETGFYYGNLNGDGNKYFGASGVDSASFYGYDNTLNEFLIGGSISGSNGFPTVDLNVLNDTHRYGFSASDNGGKKTSNIYYALWDGSSTTDISRLEANKNEVHARKLIDDTGVLPNYNGFHANNTYTQLEYNKQSEDGQVTGTLWTLNEDGIAHYQNGSILNQLDNSGNLLFGDAITDGTWKFDLSGGNFALQKRVSGSWVTKQLWT